MTSNNDSVDIKQLDADESQSALRKYARVTTGSPSLLNLLRYEFILFICTSLFGAVGIAFRRFLYPAIFKSFGKNVTIGRNVTIRGAGKIRIGKNVMIDDGCVLDARGDQTEIVIGDNTLISGDTVIRARNALIDIGEGCSIGRSCLLGTDRKIILGDEVLLGAYTYICGGGVHKFDSPEVSVLSQGIEESKGIEIGMGAWLGTRTTVLDGVDVGKGAVVGAHSLVTKTIPEMVIAFGSPARVQKERVLVV